MASPGWNPHKKGEHVFNDIAGALENAFSSALQTDRASFYVLQSRFGSLELRRLPQLKLLVDNLLADEILKRARTVVAPATGVHDDLNSRTFGHATHRLTRILSDLVAAIAELTWRKLPHPNSSFSDFDKMVTDMQKTALLKADAFAAVDQLIDCAHDREAETGALSERVSDTEVTRRREAIDTMKQYRSNLKLAGHALVTTLADELERVVERRITEP